MTPLDAFGLAAAAFIASGINAVAGGGSLVSFPALLAAGYPAKTANVTNAVALWPGYLGGSLGYRSLLAPQRETIVKLGVSSIVGAIAGSVILLSTPESAFEAIVPFLILFASALLAFQTQVAAFAARFRRRTAGDGVLTVELHAAVMLNAVYGAYFGAGLGTLMLATLSILLPDLLHRSNALKGLLAMVINGVAAVSFALFGPVEWLPAIVMAAAAMAGGYLGVGVARRFRARVLRIAIVTYSVVVAIVLLVR